MVILRAIFLVVIINTRILDEEDGKKQGRVSLLHTWFWGAGRGATSYFTMLGWKDGTVFKS